MIINKLFFSEIIARVSLIHVLHVNPRTSLWTLNKQSLHLLITWKPQPTLSLIRANNMINTSLNQRNEKQVVTTCTAEGDKSLSKQNSLDRKHKMKQVLKPMADKHRVRMYKKCWAAKPGCLNTLLSSSLNHCYFFLNPGPRFTELKWIDSDSPNKLTEKEWLMNIADATHSSEGSGSALMRRTTLTAREYSWYESYLQALTGGSTPQTPHTRLLFLTPADDSALCVSGRHLATWTNIG